MKYFKLFVLTLLLLSVRGFSQTIPSEEVVNTTQLVNYLKPEVKAALIKNGPITEAVLAKYFRNKFAERYFYNWNNFESRFANYNRIYANVEQSHTENALDHLKKYAGITNWKLPFNYLNGSPVNAYAIRHLARQHKTVDIGFYYYYQDKNPKYIDYFTNQVQSLNQALHLHQYETIEDGNGIYEVFHSGYRILNWLAVHNMFLSQPEYSDKEQLVTIATLLQHGANLYVNNPSFQSGNHQTRGMSGLAMLAILFRDFNDSDLWYKRSMALLEDHLAKEINADGFQFERTIHYHISDIENYFYVYQLAKLSKLPVNSVWTAKLQSQFITLTKIAYPDKSAPVFSDDTDEPWAEKNNISGALTLGYLLFESPDMGYFANKNVPSDIFWYVNDEQLKMLADIKSKAPEFKEAAFTQTGYYIMREGWKPDDKMMSISAGLDDKKPDHQHGDMLGIQAMANGKVVLPNYQVRYSLPDYEFFKNSLVKNVALVDNELQGQQYKLNKGDSGFGKFYKLPQPQTVTWKNKKDLDVYIGKHDGFENIGVNYSRQVIYIKDDFWVVKDNFTSNQIHNYKQVWQGHYTLENAPNLLHATFDDAAGFDIYQINKVDTSANAGKRGKQWTVVEKSNQKNFSFITVLYPYKGFSNILEESDTLKFKGWALNQSKWKMKGLAPVSLSKNNKAAFFGVNEIAMDDLSLKFSETTDVFVSLNDAVLSVQSIGESQTEILFRNKKSLLKPGEVLEFKK